MSNDKVSKHSNSEDKINSAVESERGIIRARGPGFFFALGLLYVLVLATALIARTAEWLWIDRIPDPIGGIIPIAVPWFGALGAVTISLYGVFAHSHEWETRWNYWHVARPLVGAVLGTMAFLIFVGVIRATGSNPQLQTTTAAELIPYFLIAFVVGFREETFRTLITRVVDTLLGPETEEAPQVIVSIRPSPIDFGKVRVGSHKAIKVTVQNTGKGNLIIDPSGVQLKDEKQERGPDRGPFALVEDSVAGATLPPQASAQLTIRFQPEEPRKYESQLTIRSTGGIHTANVLGEGVEDEGPPPPATE